MVSFSGTPELLDIITSSQHFDDHWVLMTQGHVLCIIRGSFQPLSSVESVPLHLF